MYKQHIWQRQPINIYQDPPLGSPHEPILAQAQEVLQLILPWANSDMTGPSPPKLRRPILGNLLMKGIQIHNSDETRVLWRSNPIPYTHLFFEKFMIA